MKLKNIYTQNNTNHFIRMYVKSMINTRIQLLPLGMKIKTNEKKGNSTNRTRDESEPPTSD